MDDLVPKDGAEALALFRAQVIGPLLCREPSSHGELSAALREIAAQPVLPPGAEVSRTYAASTLERWYYAFKKQGLLGLRSRSRGQGHALQLTAEQRALLLAVRRDHPRVSAALIVRTLVAEGRLADGTVSESTVRRLYAEAGLDRQALSQGAREPRRRWEAHAPNVLWHSDVCHGPSLRIDGRAVPLRIHALLDDHSRYVVAIQAAATERESEMLALMVKALRLHGAPEVLYLDNGSTYSGHALATACGRLGIGLVHAKPYDPEARGKMERFWRTLREQCLDHCAQLPSLHDVQVRMLAWLDRHYHITAHSALMGKCPAEVYEAHQPEMITESMLHEALLVRGRRRVRRDGTLQVAGTDFELLEGYLAGRVVIVARSLLDPTRPPWVEHEQQRLPLRPVDPQANARRKDHRARKGIDAVAFDPAGALLDRVVGRTHKDGAP
jgi:transposase InsO family protein